MRSGCSASIISSASRPPCRRLPASRRSSTCASGCSRAPRSAGRSFENRVVLFVHGAGTPAEVSFDVPYQDYSWMGHLARAGFDVFSVDMTGYGRSTRPFPMNDPCNLAPGAPGRLHGALQGQLSGQPDDDRLGLGRRGGGRGLHPRAAPGGEGEPRGVVARRSARRRLRGAPPAEGESARPARAGLQPADARRGPGQAAVEGVVFNTQSRAEFEANWERQVGCPAQYDPAARDSVWSEMLASDPVGRRGGRACGARRRPRPGAGTRPPWRSR